MFFIKNILRTSPGRAWTEYRTQRYTLDPNLFLFCERVHVVLNQLPPNYLCPLSLLFFPTNSLLPPLTLTSSPATFRWFNGNYSVMGRNEKSRVHWLFVKSYLFKSEEAWKLLGHAFLYFAERPFVITTVRALLFFLLAVAVFYDCNASLPFINEWLCSMLLYFSPYL